MVLPFAFGFLLLDWLWGEVLEVETTELLEDTVEVVVGGGSSRMVEEKNELEREDELCTKSRLLSRRSRRLIIAQHFSAGRSEPRESPVRETDG